MSPRDEDDTGERGKVVLCDINEFICWEGKVLRGNGADTIVDR